MREKSDNSRRSFLKPCVAGAVGLGAGKLAIPAGVQPEPSGKSKVVVARDPELYGKSSDPDPVLVQKLLDHAMQSFYDTPDALAAWKKVVHPAVPINVYGKQNSAVSRLSSLREFLT